MKKWAIVNKTTNTVEQIYDAESINRARYGGPWSWPEMSEHIELPEELYSVSDISTLEAYDTERQVGSTFQIVKDQAGNNRYFEVYSEDGSPLLDDEGIHIVDVKYVEVPTMEAIRSIRVK